MLSILIPIYNWNIKDLIINLQSQCDLLKIDYEIICIDDGSIASIRIVNSNSLEELAVQYFELKKNIGRSKIRNVLCRKSKYSNLLFLDCDSSIVNPNFIQVYLQEFQNTNEVVYVGGTVYNDKKPKDPKKRLHWLFGNKREALLASKRNSRPYELLHTNNLNVPREILITHPFDESITEYGYEDLEWATRLQKAFISVIHIDNPVRHDGLKDHDKFIRGVKKATCNLASLHSANKISSTRLIRAYDQAKKWGLRPFLRLLRPPALGLIKISSLSLFAIDLLKIYYFDKSTEKQL